MQKVLGEGSFGKVFKVNLKGDSDPQRNAFAMKVLDKKSLMKSQNLKYAVSEANVLKRFSHPFIVKLHYSF